MIELDRVTRIYDGRAVVDGLSLTVDRGALCVLIGPSGCGKSTTLKLINRLAPLDGGTVRIDGEDVSALPAEALRRRIGFTIQSAGLFPHWTVADNIATVPRLLKWPERRVRDRVAELLDLVRLDPAQADRYPGRLSGGEQQRVGVARALAADPDLLLMDEPFGALDPITRDGLQSELSRIHRATGKTIILVTHDMDEALRLADRIALMRQGRLVQVGSPRDIVEHPSDDFVAAFVGRARRGLALLAIATVGERVRSDENAGGSPVPADLSLREALAEMMVRHVDRLPVAAADGRLLGVIRLADIVN